MPLLEEQRRLQSLFSCSPPSFMGRRLPQTHTCPHHFSLENPEAFACSRTAPKKGALMDFQNVPYGHTEQDISPWYASILLQPLPLRRKPSGCLHMWVLNPLRAHPLSTLQKAFRSWLLAPTGCYSMYLQAAGNHWHNVCLLCINYLLTPDPLRSVPAS